MTRRKQPWGEQRGWIVPADGSPLQEWPPHLVGHKLIAWSGPMPENQPTEPVKGLASKHYYHRHVLNPEGVSVYVPEGRDAESLPFVAAEFDRNSDREVVWFAGQGVQPHRS
jgi:hypothetical protein